MTALQLRLMKRVIKRRLDDGETFDEIIASYPKLTEEEIAQIKIDLGIDEVEEESEEEE